MLIGICKCWCVKVLGSACAILYSSVVFAELHVENAWVKLAPPGAMANAAYMQFYNDSDTAVIIQSLSANCCAGLMLHRTRYKNDQVVMEHLDQLIVPPKSQVKLMPGGIHIMLFQAAKPMQLGEQIEIELHFANDQQQTIYLLVKSNDD